MYRESSASDAFLNFLASIGLITLLLIAVVVFCDPEEQEIDKFKREAIEKGYAQYVADTQGKVSFIWIEKDIMPAVKTKQPEWISIIKEQWKEIK